MTRDNAFLVLVNVRDEVTGYLNRHLEGEPDAAYLRIDIDFAREALSASLDEFEAEVTDDEFEDLYVPIMDALGLVNVCGCLLGKQSPRVHAIREIQRHIRRVLDALNAGIMPAVPY